MNKQREEFEKEIKEWYPLAECIAKERNISICDLYPIEWSLWQTSSIPDGYVVVPKHTIETLVTYGSSYASEYDIDDLHEAVNNYKAMIEAVEKNDE